MDAACRVCLLRERLDVRGQELGQLTMFKNEINERMRALELLELGRGRGKTGLPALNPFGREFQFVEENDRELRRGRGVERVADELLHLLLDLRLLVLHLFGQRSEEHTSELQSQ